MEHNYICNVIFCLPALYFAGTWSRNILINTIYLYRAIFHNKGDRAITVLMTNLFIIGLRFIKRHSKQQSYSLKCYNAYWKIN